MDKLTQIFYKPIENSPIIVFRIVFGFLLFAEGFGAILTGWVNRAFVSPQIHFTFIGFEFLENLSGPMMYFYFACMGTLGLFVMLGFYYRVSMLGFAILWTGAYLGQKTHYNNHYYLLMLLNYVMVFVPAHHYFSLDVKRKPSLKKNTCPQWVYILLIAKLGIVYTYASIAKIYPDWLAGTPIQIWFSSKINYPIIGALLQEKWLQNMILYGGILFDGLAVPLLLWRKTRVFTFIIGIFFHLFNSIVFGIGIFPYLMIGYAVLFFKPEIIRKRFFKKKESLLGKTSDVTYPKFAKLSVIIILLYLLIHIALPLRHHFYKGNVFWTEEGHRLAWRMMLRIKHGRAYFVVKDEKNKKQETIPAYKYLTPKQANKVATHPDMLWQFVQFLKKEYQKKGYENPAIYAYAKASLNGRPLRKIVDEKVDLAKEEWYMFKHSDWIIPFQE